jgi:hypothetical protein
MEATRHDDDDGTGSFPIMITIGALTTPPGLGVDQGRPQLS